ACEAVRVSPRAYPADRRGRGDHPPAGAAAGWVTRCTSMSPLAVRTWTVRPGRPVAGAAGVTDRSLRVLPDMVTRSSHTPVPSVTPTDTSPEAQVIRTTPRRAAPIRTSPEAVVTRAPAAICSTATSPLAEWMV